MTSIASIFKKKTVERVRSSQLGMFIHAATGGDPLKIRSFGKLAELISAENEVDCRISDLEEYYNIVDAIDDDDMELGI